MQPCARQEIVGLAAIGRAQRNPHRAAAIGESPAEHVAAPKPPARAVFRSSSVAHGRQRSRLSGARDRRKEFVDAHFDTGHGQRDDASEALGRARMLDSGTSSTRGTAA
ncbi:hypothetical protein BGV66_24690 [Burkholderia ubonensis]|uniref:Uncharacterized protein n=1 Tax=Burkholderia ubonensis TaxID=101571 RepID=A0ABD6PXW7_9BURK|nr:hypothetical protein BGV66_24690 [Burkholderia ubonensis]